MAQFTDGTSGVFVSNLPEPAGVPEPAGALLLVPVLLLGTKARRNRP